MIICVARFDRMWCTSIMSMPFFLRSWILITVHELSSFLLSYYSKCTNCIFEWTKTLEEAHIFYSLSSFSFFFVSFLFINFSRSGLDDSIFSFVSCSSSFTVFLPLASRKPSLPLLYFQLFVLIFLVAHRSFFLLLPSG